jgi:hypothetical protein
MKMSVLLTFALLLTCQGFGQISTERSETSVKEIPRAIKLLEFKRITKHDIDEKIIPLWKSFHCDDPSQLYVIVFGTKSDIARIRTTIARSWLPKCDLSGYSPTFVDGAKKTAGVEIWKVPAGADPPKP